MTDVLEQPVGSEESNDEDKFMKLLDDINDGVMYIKGSLTNMKTDLNKKELSTAEGISILEVKNHMLLTYLTNVLHLMLRKCHGKTIVGNLSVDYLVEIRTILERIKPIENKLKYQINKLMKIAATGVTDTNNPTLFRANPNNMVNKGTANASDESNEEDDSGQKSDINVKESKEKVKSGIYRPPKLVATHYDEDENKLAKKEKQLEWARRRALNSSVMQELREEYLDTPIEVTQSNSFRQKQSDFEKRKQEYEETYFTRLPLSKKEKLKNRRLTGGNLEGITNFEDISVLDPTSSRDSVKKSRKRSGKQGSMKRKGFKSKKRRFH